MMFRNSDRSRRKWLAEDDGEGLGVKCGGSSALLSPSLCVSPGTLSPTQKHMKLHGLRIFPFALTAEKSSRLTKLLKLINFSCACRDITLISLLSSRARAVQLPDNSKKGEPQGSGVPVVCSFVPSWLPVNGRVKRTEAASQTCAAGARCAAPPSPGGIVGCVRRRRFPKAGAAVAGGGFTQGVCRSRGMLVQGAFENPLQKCKCFPSLKPTWSQAWSTNTKHFHNSDMLWIMVLHFIFFSCVKHFAP